jgi:N-acetylneuraminate synthase
MIHDLELGQRLIGPEQPCYLVAEAGVNHNGDLNLAKKLVDVAYEAGADAIKFQIFKTEELIVPDAPKASYQKELTSEAETQYQMLKSLELSKDQHQLLFYYCEEVGITYLSTPYDYDSADFLESLGVKAIKIASTDTTNIPFLKYLSHKHTPIILSTGMATLCEVEQAIDALTNSSSREDFILLHCTSEYPAPLEETNLRSINTLREAFKCLVGFSDHTYGIGASPWAVALGACVIEKHFTIDKTMSGPDHRASLDPIELKQWVKTIRDVEAALGDGIKRPMPSEISNIPYMRKSVVAKKNISAGEVITQEHLICKRPGLGLSPIWYEQIVGKKTLVEVPAEKMISLGDIDWANTL